MQKAAPWVVLKFGGTSLTRPERWRTIAEIVRARRQEGFRPFVVCSALAGVTDRLARLADGDDAAGLALLEKRHAALAAGGGVRVGAGRRPLERLTRLVREQGARPAPPPLRARLLAQGELLSTRIGAAFLAGEGLRARWHDARTALQSTDDPHAPAARRYLNAACPAAPDAALQAALAHAPAEVYVTQGFIARNPAGETVLIGRGGSDTSAAYFAAKLEAARLEVWTDVPGLFTTDPRTDSQARLLRHLHYDEAQELATMGAQVLHPRALAPVRRYGIPLHVRATTAPHLAGTVIANEAPDAGPLVKAVAVKKGVALVSARAPETEHTSGFLADVFAALHVHGFSADLVAASPAGAAVTLDPLTNTLGGDALNALAHDLGACCAAEVIRPVAVVSLVGRALHALLPRLGPALEALADRRLHLSSQAPNGLHCGFVVNEAEADELAHDLHEHLCANQPLGDVFGPSWSALAASHPQASEAPLRPAV